MPPPPSTQAVTVPADTVEASRPSQRVWIIEDHVLFRELLGDFLRLRTGTAVVGSSSDETGLLEACDAGGVDVVILDLNLNRSGGMRILEALSRRPSFPAVMILSGTATEHSVQLATRLGARAYVDKTAALDEVALALARIASGGVYFSEAPSRLLSQLAFRGVNSEVNPDLTARETEILRRVARGVMVKEIATDLKMSKWAVYRVRAELLRKLAARSDRDLISYALRIGLADLEGAGMEEPAAG